MAGCESPKCRKLFQVCNTVYDTQCKTVEDEKCEIRYEDKCEQKYEVSSIISTQYSIMAPNTLLILIIIWPSVILVSGLNSRG